MKNGHMYVLGTGYSHNGSACLLKDGKVCVAIEKERLTRRKHDGYNDNLAIQYCLDAENITLDDLDVIVQGGTTAEPQKDYYYGERLLSMCPDVPVHTISHHLAHAYSTIGTCEFKQDFNIVVIDGSGSSFDQCLDLPHFVHSKELITEMPHLFLEKESYYSYKNNLLTPVFKDFSAFGYVLKDLEKYAWTMHSIGCVYEMFAKYCFGDFDDPGKLMGLAPYGRADIFKDPVYELRDGRFFVNYDCINKFRTPARSYAKLKEEFQYYADIAYWVQRETERAVLYVMQSRLEQDYAENLCYAGGVALNAVANAKILRTLKISNLYMQPAAGDNGIAIGCAYYGWLEILKRERPVHNASTFFGKPYNEEKVLSTLKNYKVCHPLELKPKIDNFFEKLNNQLVSDSLSGNLLQINLEDIGIYQLEFNDKSLSVHQEVKHLPTSRIKLDGHTFLNGLQNRNYFKEMVSRNMLQVTKPTEVQAIFEAIDFEDIYRKTQNVNGESYRQPFVYRKMTERASEIAELLANGKIIGLFQEGSEFGPRALGHRSILADPRLPGVRDFINTKIKLREDFRPFAPAVLREDLLVYFKYDWESPYMILVNEVREEWREQLKSVIHIDNSARVQTVTKGWNDSFYGILSEFKKQTGLSVLLNTSFNIKGMPIVETPQEALDLFLSSKLDALVLENYVIEKI